MACKCSSRELVSPTSFEYHEQLGSGSFGNVYRVTLRSSGEELALKVIERKRDNKYAFVEREIMAESRHPYLLSLRFAFQHEGRLALVMPLCSRGDLGSLVKRRTRLTENLSRHYLAQLVLAVGHLHDRGVLHRDLKPENVLLDDDQQAVLADFGISKAHAGSEPATSLVGSVAYVSPEVLWQRGYDYAVDVWGLGVTLYALVVGRSPFRGANREHIWHNIKWAPLELPEYLSESCAALLGETLRKQPRRRLGGASVRGLEGHGFFAGVDFGAMLRREVPCPEPTPMPRRSRRANHRREEPQADQLRRVFGEPRARGLCFLKRPPLQGWDFSADSAVLDLSDVSTQDASGLSDIPESVDELDSSR